MSPNDTSVLGLLRQALAYHSDRQKVIAENVANANTPGFTPSDIPMSEFDRAVSASQAGPSRVGLAVTDSGHRSGASTPARSFTARSAPDSETTINGNSVVLEEQMVKASENRMRFETALSLYQKSLMLVRMAVRPPGQ
ncbi:MAG: flagellar basal body protein [Pseudomonadota bacterium]